MTKELDPVVIVGMARTPIGALMGQFAGVTAPELGAIAIGGALKDAKLAGEEVDQVLMGNVLSAGLGQAPARQAALGAHLPQATQATTLNKMCGSGLQAVVLARALLASGQAQTIVAGGMESMSNAPHLLTRHRAGVKYGHDKVHDHMALDGLEDAYEHEPMGVFADRAARLYQLSREAQDAYALETLRRTQQAASQGVFEREIVEVEIAGKPGPMKVRMDELPTRARPDKIAQLKPAFVPDGTITAANASAISDGAAALVLMRRSRADELGLTPLATIRASAAHAHEPAWFATAPVPAMRKALEIAGWSVGDVDLFEINEAFAVVPMIAMQELSISHDVVNVHGGACALGHPIGASGARVLVTLIHAMQVRNARRGVASLCIGGGEGIAIAIER